MTIRLTNYTGKDFPLITGHVIPAGGSIDTTKGVVNANSPWLTGQIRRGLIGIGDPVADEEPNEERPSEAEIARTAAREEIKGMKHADLDPLLEMHGCETGGNLAEKRERLSGAMFIE